MPTFRRMRRSIAVLLLILSVPACYHYATPKGVTPQEYILAKHPEQVRVTLADSSRFLLREPWVSVVSLGGRLLPARDSRGFLTRPGAPTWAVPLSEVRRIEGYQFNVLGVVGLTATVLVLAAGTLVVLWLSAVAASQ